MENIQMRSFHGKVVLQQQNGQARVITTTPANFTRVPDVNELQIRERPMMLNAWTQTIPAGMDYLQDGKSNVKCEERRQTENDLREKIRFLEESIRTHSEIFAQLHAAKANCQCNANIIRQHNIQASFSTPPISVTPAPLLSPQQMQQPYTQNAPQQMYRIPKQEHHPQQTQRQQQYDEGISTDVAENVADIINPVQQEPIESVNYTIIAEANSDANGSPIEIQLTEENGGMNCSADSERLQICLADETSEIKSGFARVEAEVLASQQCSQERPESPHSTYAAKRRRFNKKLSEQSTTITQKYYVNDSGTLTAFNASNTAAEIRVKPPLTPMKAEHLNANILKCKEQNELQNQDPRIDLNNVMVSIGPYNTRVPAKVYESISWASASLATRKLLMAVFDRQTLATHSMTGKPSPAFKNDKRPLKERLNQSVVKDIIYAVTRKCHVSEKEVRSAITTKCADENKMMKLQESKLQAMIERNKENLKADE